MSSKRPSYWELLQDPRWQRKRLEVMQRDSFAGQSIREVANQEGIAERTIRRWLCSPKAQKIISRYRSQITSSALGRLNEGLLAAADTLVDLLKAESEQTRLGAARTIIESVVRLREVTEFEERLRYLEERDAERQKKRERGPECGR